MLTLLTSRQHIQNLLTVRLTQNILVRALIKELRSIHEQHRMILTAALLQHQNAGRNARTVEQVGGQLNHSIHHVLLQQILTNLTFRTATVQHARELNDSRRTRLIQRRQHVHRKRQISLRLRRQHSRRGVTVIVNQGRVIITLPLGRIRRVRHNRTERLLKITARTTAVLRVNQSITVRNTEIIHRHAVQNHVHTAQVVSGQVNLLTHKTQAVRVLTQLTLKLQQQRARTTRRVIHGTNLLGVKAIHSNLRQQLRNLLRSVVLAAALTRISRVHAHQVLVSVTESVILAILVALLKVHVRHSVHELEQVLVTSRRAHTQLVGVQHKVVEEALHVILGLGATRRLLKRLKHVRQGLVQVLILASVLIHIREQLRRQQEKAALIDEILFNVIFEPVVWDILKAIRHVNILALNKAHLALREVTVEKHAQHVLLKVPAVYRTTQVIRNTPNRRVQLRTLSVAVTVLVSGSGRIRRLRRHRGGQPLISYRFYSRRNAKSSEPVRSRSYTCASAGLDALLGGSVRSFHKPFRTRRRELFQYTGSPDPARSGSSSLSHWLFR